MEEGMIHYRETEYGFEYGNAIVTRLFSDIKKGWITIGIESVIPSGGPNLAAHIG